MSLRQLSLSKPLPHDMPLSADDVVLMIDGALVIVDALAFLFCMVVGSMSRFICGNEFMSDVSVVSVCLLACDIRLCGLLGGPIGSGSHSDVTWVVGGCAQVDDGACTCC